MGSAVGQVPEYLEMVTRWVKAATRMPVIVKLTPNVADIRYAARASRAGGADAVSLINTVNSIASVNLDTFSPEPSIDRSAACRTASVMASACSVVSLVAASARAMASVSNPEAWYHGVSRRQHSLARGIRQRYEGASVGGGNGGPHEHGEAAV